MNWEQTKRREFKASVGGLVEVTVNEHLMYPSGDLQRGDRSRAFSRWGTSVEINGGCMSTFSGEYSTEGEAKIAALRSAERTLTDGLRAVQDALAAAVVDVRPGRVGDSHCGSTACMCGFARDGGGK